MVDNAAGETAPPVDGEPLFLVARRGRARIRIGSENRGEPMLQRVRTPLRGIPLPAPQGGPLSHALLIGTVTPGQAPQGRLSLEVHPQAPPGLYHGILQLGEQERPLTLFIPEERRIRSEPRRFELDVEPGATVEHLVAITNLGNVPVTIRDPEPAELSPSDPWLGAVRRAARETPSDDYEDFLNTFVARAREMLQADRARHIQVSVKDAPFELAPGKTAVLTLRWQVPQELERGQRYEAELVVAGAPVLLQVRSPRNGGSPGAEGPPARPKTRRRA